MANTIECKETNGEGMLLILRKMYSLEKSRSILQTFAEDDFYEDDNIQILKSLCNSDLFYYMLKPISE